MRSSICVLYVTALLELGESRRTGARFGLIWKDHMENIWQSGNLILNLESPF